MYYNVKFVFKGGVFMLRRTKQRISQFTSGGGALIGLIILFIVLMNWDSIVSKIQSISIGGFLLLIGLILLINYSKLKRGGFRGKWF